MKRQETEKLEEKEKAKEKQEEEEGVRETDITFIRHGQSLFNVVSRQYRFDHNLGHKWAEISKNRAFLNSVKYNPELIDSALTQEGIKQCQQAKKVMDYRKPDLILVSPLERALETCHLMFKGRQIPKIVQPLLAEGLVSACDISHDIAGKIKRFPGMDFTKVEKSGDIWYIKHQSQEHRQQYEGAIKQYQKGNGVNPGQSIHQCILQHMQETQIYEMPRCMRQRASKVKQMLKDYRLVYSNIVVVAHYNIINYVVCRSFDPESYEPLEKPVYFNCQIYDDDLKNIIEVG